MTAKMEYTVKCIPCIFVPKINRGTFRIIRNTDIGTAGISQLKSIDVPEIPLS